MRNMKRAIVLAGGGARGAYEAGFVRAIKEIGLTYDIVTGTSIGALNGALLVQKEEERLIDLWEHMTKSRVLNDGGLPDSFNIDELLKESNRVATFFKKYIKEKGADITPLKEMIQEYYREDKFLNSAIEYGLVTVEYPTLKYHYITKEHMKSEGGNYLLASASCFPAFPKCSLNNTQFIDGGYYDNLPIELAIKLGADEIIAVDLNETLTHPQFLNKPNITYIYPSFPLGSFLSFDQESLKNNCQLGYYDTMKKFNKMAGLRYTFKQPLERPAFFDRYYMQLLLVEHRMSKQFLITMDGLVTSKLAKMYNRTVLSIDDINYAVFDYFMAMKQMNPYECYEVDTTIQMIQTYFEEAFDENYAMFPGLNPKEIIKAVQSLDRKELIMKIIYHLCYPEKNKLPWSVLVNVFSFEAAMALWVVTSKGITCQWEDL